MMSEDQDSAIPHAPMAEKAVLSTMFRKPEVWIPRALGDGLTRDHFWQNRAMWDAMLARYEAELSFELVSFITDAQMKAGVLDGLGGPAGVTEIYTYATEGQSSAWADWLRALRHSYSLRLAISKGRELADVADSGGALMVATEAMEAIAKALTGPQRATTGKQLMMLWLEWFERSYKSGDLPGLSTGFPHLDGITGGMREAELWVVLGLPSRGKSVLMMEIAAFVLHEGGSAAVFSLEMNKIQVASRLLSTRGPVSMGSIMQPKTCGKMDLQILRRTMQAIAEERLHVDDQLMDIHEICAEAERIRDSTGRLDLVVVDYIQLAIASADADTREQEVSKVTKKLKTLAKRLGCPVVTGSQLNEKGKARESRSIEQDADVMLFIVDDGILVGKNRNGARGEVMPLFLDGQFQRFKVGTREDH